MKSLVSGEEVDQAEIDPDEDCGEECHLQKPFHEGVTQKSQKERRQNQKNLIFHQIIEDF